MHHALFVHFFAANARLQRENFQSDCFSEGAEVSIIGTLRNHDDDGNGNVIKQLCTCITLFCTFICLHFTATTWNDQILSLLWNGNGKAVNSTISVRTWARSPLPKSSQNPLLLGNRANWDNREKNWNDAKSVFKRWFHGGRRCRIVRSLITDDRQNTSSSFLREVGHLSPLNWKLEIKY